MATETTVAKDVTARLKEARAMTDLFEKFGSRGLDAYDSATSWVYDALDDTEIAWRLALRNVVRELITLRDDTAGWFDKAEQRAVEAKISQFETLYAKLR